MVRLCEYLNFQINLKDISVSYPNKDIGLEFYAIGYKKLQLGSHGNYFQLIYLSLNPFEFIHFVPTSH